MSASCDSLQAGSNHPIAKGMIKRFKTPCPSNANTHQKHSEADYINGQKKLPTPCIKWKGNILKCRLIKAFEKCKSDKRVCKSKSQTPFLSKINLQKVGTSKKTTHNLAKPRSFRTFNLLPLEQSNLSASQHKQNPSGWHLHIQNPPERANYNPSRHYFPKAVAPASHLHFWNCLKLAAPRQTFPITFSTPHGFHFPNCLGCTGPRACF